MPATVWKGYLSFGLVSFPVALHSAARPESIHFHMLHRKDHARIKERWYCSEENKPVERADIVKGYEYSKGEYVVVDDEDLKKIAPPTATSMEILQFVKAGDVDPIFFETSYYVAPGESNSKPYALLMAALNSTKYFAVAQVTMHMREHIAILRPSDRGLVLHTMFYQDELHEEKIAHPGKSSYSSKEMDLAKSLINALAGPFKPEQFHDQYRQNVEKLIEQKQKGEKIKPVAQPKKAPVVDILDALKKSLAQSSHSAPAAKKPAVRKHSGRRSTRHAA